MATNEKIHPLKTKIICTIGPSSKKHEILAQMVELGMAVARFNLSHGKYDEFKQWAEDIRALSSEKNKPVAILCDLQGPKIRLGTLYDNAKSIELKGEEIIFVGERKPKNAQEFSIDYEKFFADVKEGERILINDGKVELHVIEKKKDGFTAKVKVGGTIAPFQGVNLPETDLSLPSLSEKDLTDLKFALELGADAIGLSFVLRAEDVKNLRTKIREFCADMGRKAEPWIVAKIERREAVNDIKNIVKAADVIMVARGDLGLELPEAEVPILQKQIISECISSGKPVVTATQMLDSMQQNPRPTRAEVSDVANAIIDGTDCVMLSGETTMGKYPVESVAEMKKIIAETEKGIYQKKNVHRYEFHFNGDKGDEGDVTNAVGQSACMIARQLHANFVVCATGSGYTARMIAKTRSEMPIIALTPHRETYRLLSFLWGVTPFILPGYHTTDELLTQTITLLKEEGLVKAADVVVVTAGHPVGEVGKTNLIKVERIV